MRGKAKESPREARDATGTYARAIERVHRRRRLLRVACARDADPRVIDRAAALTAEAVLLVKNISDKHFGNLDAGEQGDWIKEVLK